MPCFEGGEPYSRDAHSGSRWMILVDQSPRLNQQRRASMNKILPGLGVIGQKRREEAEKDQRERRSSGPVTELSPPFMEFGPDDDQEEGHELATLRPDCRLPRTRAGGVRRSKR